MRHWSAQELARAAGARLIAGQAAPGGPLGVSIDSRTLAPGELFVGLVGEREDGGSHAIQALRDGAWGVLVGPEPARAAAGAHPQAIVLEHDDPLAGMQLLARAWGAELRAAGAKIVAITGSTGKTSTKDILAALLATGLRVSCTPANLKTEIGLPLVLLAAPAGVEVIVLEMAMRGAGQISELTAIAQPDVGVIVNVGPAHLELLGSIEAIAAAKAELIDGLAAGATAVIPAGEQLLAPHLRGDLEVISFGEGGEVSLLEHGRDGEVLLLVRGRRIRLRPSFHQAHNLSNLLAAVAAASAIGYVYEGPLEVRFSASRGQRLALAGGVTLIDDCYNANPMSMRAAIDDLSETASAGSRAVAVLGDMLELGADAPRLHREIGEHARDRGVELLITVGPLAAAMVPSFAGAAHAVPDAAAAATLLAGLLKQGDTVLVKGSRGVGLERVSEALVGSAGGDTLRAPRAFAPSAGHGQL